MTQENPNIINLETPYREGAPGYLNLLHRFYSELGGIIAHEGTDNLRMRVSFMTDLMVNSVVVEEVQEKLREYKAAKIDENLAKLGNKRNDVDSKNKAIYEACMDTVGMISRYTNLYLGVSKKLSVIIEDPVTELKTGGDE